MRHLKESKELVWALVDESLASAGFATYQEGDGWPWRWIVKHGTIDNEMLWVGHEFYDLNIIKVGRTAKVQSEGKVLGEVNVADPEFCPKLLTWVESGIKLFHEHPELFR